MRLETYGVTCQGEHCKMTELLPWETVRSYKYTTLILAFVRTYAPLAEQAVYNSYNIVRALLIIHFVFPS